MNKLITIDELKMSKNGFLVNNQIMQNNSEHCIFVFKDFFNVLHYENINYNQIISLLSDKQIMNRILIEIDDYEKSIEIINKINSKCKITSSFILTNFEGSKLTSKKEIKKFGDISFVSDQTEVMKHNSFLMNVWEKDYYSQLAKFISAEDISSQMSEHEVKQKDYKRFLALKNNKPVAELGFLDIQHRIFDQKVRAMSAWIDQSLAIEERKYIWAVLFEKIQNENILFSAIYTHNKQSIKLFLKNKYKINHLLIYPY